jgi:DUF4097 and DUF4098 domain-containing protein YvlB
MATWEIDGPRKLPLEDVRQLRVSTVRGTVNVVGTDGPPSLEVTQVKGRALRVRTINGRVEVTQDWHAQLLALFLAQHRRGPIELTVAVPRDCPVELRLIASDGVVSGLRSRVGARAVSGSLTLVGLSGPVEAQSVSGAIEAHGVSGGLRTETVSGEITLVAGSGNIHGKSVSGAITVDPDAALDGDVTLSTTSGDITVRVPEESALRVQFHSTSGQIASAFPELARADMPGMHMAQGVLGAGTGRLWASSTSGHLSLLRRGAIEELS